jgi:uncharacterized protein (DUF2147 family)
LSIPSVLKSKSSVIVRTSRWSMTSFKGEDIEALKVIVEGKRGTQKRSSDGSTKGVVVLEPQLEMFKFAAMSHLQELGQDGRICSLNRSGPSEGKSKRKTNKQVGSIANSPNTIESHGINVSIYHSQSPQSSSSMYVATLSCNLV